MCNRILETCVFYIVLLMLQQMQKLMSWLMWLPPKTSEHNAPPLLLLNRLFRPVPTRLLRQVNAFEPLACMVRAPARPTWGLSGSEEHGF